MAKALIIDAVRTPIGRKNGLLSSIPPVELASIVLRAVLERCNLKPDMIDDVIMGCVTQTGEQGANIGRLACLLAGFPVDVPSVTINRMCGSSQQAIHFASQAIESGDMDLVIAAGVESMSRVPLGSDYAPFHPGILERYPLVNQGISAEMIAEKWNISREDMDRFSLESHRKAAYATEMGFFKKEIIPVEIRRDGEGPLLIEKDEGIRYDTSLEKLSSLKPAFKPDGLITAGNSSQISDGAAAVLLASERKAKELGLKPKARIVARAVKGSDPVIMLTGPIPATKAIIKKSGIPLSKIDVIEINEAFASVVIAWMRELEPDPRRVNPQGGAIALGHPVGASGARIMATLIHELERLNATLGLQTMCIGHGMATATIIERI